MELVDLVEGADVQELVDEGNRKEVPPHIQESPSPAKSWGVYNLQQGIKAHSKNSALWTVNQSHMLKVMGLLLESSVAGASIRHLEHNERLPCSSPPYSPT